MFLDLIRRRNPRLIDAAIALHQKGELPANTYVIDLDAIEDNARSISASAAKLGLTVMAMTKQMGRNDSFCRAAMRGGIGKSVAVDMECARATHRAGMEVGHIGHLVQVPRAEADEAAKLSPTWWTVFNAEKAGEAGAASERNGRRQPLLARIRGERDIFYRGHEGGFSAADVVAVAGALDKVAGARFAGITTFPAMLFDAGTRKVKPTPNLETLRRAAQQLARAGYKDIEINAPGTTSSVTLPALAEAGATQVEPGHGLTGTTPLHVVEDLPELPAVVYLTEVSHLSGGEAFCFGGGLYIDSVFPPYSVRALVSREPRTDDEALRPIEIPPPSSIDYYGMIDAAGPKKLEPGDSVVLGFRAQAFVTRAYVAGLSGLSRGMPVVESISHSNGTKAGWNPSRRESPSLQRDLPGHIGG
jgi:predicted amino acid racemase